MAPPPQYLTRRIPPSLSWRVDHIGIHFNSGRHFMIYCRIVMRYSTTNKDTVFSTPPTHRHVVEQKLLVAAGQGECGRLTRRTRFSSTGNGQQARTWPLPTSLFGRLAMNDSLSIFSTVRDRSAELLKGEPAPCTWTSRSMTCSGQAVSTGPMHEPK